MGAAGQPGWGLSHGGTRGAVCGHCPSPAMLGSKPLPVPQCSRKAAVGAPFQPLTVPLGRTCGPGCHQGSVPSALAGADRWTRRGAGGGRKLLIPLYLPLALLSHLPVTLSVSPGISRSYSCASPAAGGLPALCSTPQPGTGPKHPIPAAAWGSRAPHDLLGLLPTRSTSPEQGEAPQVPPSCVCMLSISHSGRQVPGTGLCSCSALQVGVGGKDQAQLSNIMRTEEVKEAPCCLPQKCWLLLSRGPAGYRLKINHKPFTWLSWHP